ncbi:phosphatase PAP2 family protein [Alicyclobacillus cycloheptanicus]|uniref:Undecaprenyl-diphosphatase n=1 Tax=Alicyclobacillus cycloheptanicus TaxID=1457 RepID=A0ABT9XJ38_9BACL|nr:phosphatase PAP2 family protein [Alicyclobacillus cycloheptanicus]MDQ0190054.1 undecaprenyl-diphosphatase [Alicyclobacillus cycloheptanicus]WDM02037.1 phosphatase PAP2 family protein [Alicyclobacillus cycloheptanicus]
MSGPDFPMPAGYVWQYKFIVWLQQFETPWLDRVAHWFAWLGIEGTYLLVLPIVFWSIHRKFGMRLGYVLLSSMYVNNWLKVTLSVVRPTGIPGIRSVDVLTGPSYSLPSGHTQEALTFFGALAAALRRGKKWAWLGAFVLALLMGLSRVYEGLHWPTDVLLGLALGTVFSLVGWSVGKWWTYRSYPFSVRATVALVLLVLLLLVHRGPMDAQYAGWMLGGAIGILLEERYVGSDISPAWWRRVCTAVIGMAGLIALQWVIQWPADTGWLVVRALLVSLWCTLGAPYAFVQCGLYRRVKGD